MKRDKASYIVKRNYTFHRSNRFLLQSTLLILYDIFSLHPITYGDVTRRKCFNKGKSSKFVRNHLLCCLRTFCFYRVLKIKKNIHTLTTTCSCSNTQKHAVSRFNYFHITGIHIQQETIKIFI